MNLLELMVKVGIDDQVTGKLGGIADKAKGVAGGIATAGAAVAGAAATMGAAVGAVGVQALEAYGDFEQLSGGAQLMFGDAYGYIEQRSQEAYKNVQMSQSDYLQQVNGFAVGLKTSLGGNEQAAAELADKIVTAEADIVAATGNTQENVQNAFNGIMKGNYTMLDNLQIGIKPTKEGMQEVIDKVNDWNAAQGNASNYTIDSLADCEAAVVDYVAMVGMSGYAQNEAAETIQGSLAMVQASWQNLLTEFGKDDGDVGARLGDFVASAKTALLGHIDEATGEVKGGIIPRFKEIVTSIAEILPEVIPQMVEMGKEVFGALSEAVTEVAPLIMEALTNALTEMADNVVNNSDEMAEGAVTFFTSILDTLAELAPSIVEALVSLLVSLVGKVIEHVPDILAAAGKLILALVEGIANGLVPAMGAAEDVVNGALEAIGEFFGDMLNAGAELVGNLVSGISDGIGGILDTVNQGIQDAVNAVGDFFWNMYNAGASILDGLVQGIQDGFNNAVNAVASGLEEVRSWLPFSPAKKGPFSGKGWTLYSGRSIVEGLAEGIESSTSDAEKSMRDAMDTIQDAASGGVTMDVGMNMSAQTMGLTDEIKALRAEVKSLKLVLNIDGRAFAEATVADMDEAMSTRIGRTRRAYA